MSYYKNNTFVVLILLVFLFVNGQQIPQNPCPNIFNYVNQNNNQVYGKVTIPYDGSTNLDLMVNASVKGYYSNESGARLKIDLKTQPQELIEQKVSNLLYNVLFPFQHTIPKITQIIFNGRRYCEGPPEPLIAGGSGVTGLWSEHKYFFTVDGRVQQQFPNNPFNFNSMFSSTKLPPLFIDNNNNNNNNELNSNNLDTTLFAPAAPNNSINNNEKYQCGTAKQAIVPLILGGEEITDGMFPWLAAMFVAKGLGYDYKCTGNLVSSKHVLTAARCTHFFKVQIIQTEDILFVFGKSNIAKWATNGAITRAASKVQAHPDFKQNTAHCDISVITLNKPLQFSSAILPICLWPKKDESINDIVGKKGTVAGWGRGDGSQSTEELTVPTAKYVDMPVVSDEKCLYSNLTYYSLTSEMTFCAGNRDGSGPCVGDSGAGFMMPKNGKYYLRGLSTIILTDDKQKCDLTNFIVFSDVAKVLDWIKQAMV